MTNFDLKWNESAESVFSESKQILANATLLVHPDPSAPLNITWDASDFAVGGVLQQYIVKNWILRRHVTARSKATFWQCMPLSDILDTI